MLILNEARYAENLYLGNNDEVKSVVGKVGYVTRYHTHILGCADQDNYQQTVRWMQKHHHNFDESCYSNLISDAIKRAHKTPFYYINSIKVTKKELDSIASLNNLRAEKVLFVLLCMAKQQAVSFGFTNGLVKYSLPELCKLARISVPSDEREYILYTIVQSGLLGYPKKNNTQCLIVNFIDVEGEAVLELNENGCSELAHEYLNWKNDGKGYTRCEFCGKIIKQSKSNPKRFCTKCTDVVGDVPENMKVIVCVDCGQIVCVPKSNTKTCRCEECQSRVYADSNRERQKKWYDSHIKT